MTNDEREKAILTLKKIFPDDQKLRNAVIVTNATMEQFTALKVSLLKTLVDVYDLEPGETEDWERRMALEIGAAIDWSIRLELHIHDMRSALFFRLQQRNKVKYNSPEEQAEAEQQKLNKAEAKAAVAAATAAKVPATSAPEQHETPSPTSDSDPKPANDETHESRQERLAGVLGAAFKKKA